MKSWSDIPETAKDALIEWYNCSLDATDKRRLAKLYHSGRFSHWQCPECGEDVLVGQPDDWGHFQGVLQSENIGQLCADCGGVYLRLKEYADD